MRVISSVASYKEKVDVNASSNNLKVANTDCQELQWSGAGRGADAPDCQELGAKPVGT